MELSPVPTFGKMYLFLFISAESSQQRTEYSSDDGWRNTDYFCGRNHHLYTNNLLWWSRLWSRSDRSQVINPIFNTYFVLHNISVKAFEAFVTTINNINNIAVSHINFIHIALDYWRFTYFRSTFRMHSHSGRSPPPVSFPKKKPQSFERCCHSSRWRIHLIFCWLTFAFDEIFSPNIFSV